MKSVFFMVFYHGSNKFRLQKEDQDVKMANDLVKMANCLVKISILISLMINQFSFCKYAN